MGKRAPSTTDELNRMRRAVLEGYFALRGQYHTEGLAERCRFTPQTARRKWRDLSQLKICEVVRLKGLTDEQIVMLVRGK